jgi:hypothetical protein
VVRGSGSDRAAELFRRSAAGGRRHVRQRRVTSLTPLRGYAIFVGRRGTDLVLLS